jgi:membrane protein implicated in regulation of membrane protease activity
MAVVCEPIEADRGKVRLGDSLWTAEGPDLPAGTLVRVIASRSTILLVAPANAS